MTTVSDPATPVVGVPAADGPVAGRGVRILVTGSRDWDEPAVISRALHDAWVAADTGGVVTLVSGACPTGADAIAEAVAARVGWVVERHPADWVQFGKRAGFVRNADMVAAGADVVLAFIRNNSRGATMTLDLATKAGLPTLVWRSAAPPTPRTTPVPVGL